MTSERGGAPRISVLGERALLLDAGAGEYSAVVQTRVWALAQHLEQDREAWSLEDIVLGMNNLMVVFHPRRSDCAESLQQHLLETWWALAPQELPGRVFEIAVDYDGTSGSDLHEMALHTGIAIEDVVQRHSQVAYRVACLGGMPGFAYLSGLDPSLQRSRRTVPRTRVEQGAVIIGGQQASIMPISAPTGWHILGYTDTRVFDAQAPVPCLLSAGDSVRFVVAGVRT